MDESKAREIFESWGTLSRIKIDDKGQVFIHGWFNPIELEAIAWWIRNKTKG